MKNVTLLLFLLNTTLPFSQNTKSVGPHGGEIVRVQGFQIEMIKENYRCAIHSEILGKKNDLCTKGGEKLVRDKKIEFLLFDEGFKKIDISHMEGIIRVIFKDETASTKKIRIAEERIWVLFGDNSYNNYQQAVVILKFNNNKYKAVFGEPIVHKGHHH